MDNLTNEEELSPQESLKLIGKVLDKVQDDALWRVAKKRAAFKLYFAVYIFVNLFLIGIWYFTTGIGSYFWPGWPMFAWGLGILFQYFDAYLGTSVFSEDKEFERMKKKQRKKLPDEA